MNKIEHLAYRCYKILPLVYDESLSYYEVICKCVEKLNEVITSMDEMTDEFNQWEEQIAEIEAAFDSIESTLALHTTQISGLQDDIAGLGQAIESLSESITSLTGQITTLGTTVAGHTTQIGTLETTVAGHTTQIGTLETTVAGHTTQIGTLDTTVAGHTTQIGTLETTVAGHTTQISGIQTDLTEIDSQITSLETATDDLENDKMNKANPTGTGSLSINRRATTAVGSYSLCTNYNNAATGYYSTAFGNGNTASGTAAFAHGSSTTASQNNAHSEGEGTTTGAVAQHVAGTYNVVKSTGLRVTGNGTSASAKSNAEYLDNAGNLYLAGDVYVGCQGDSTGGTKLERKIYQHRITFILFQDVASLGAPFISFTVYNNKATAYTKTTFKDLIATPRTSDIIFGQAVSGYFGTTSGGTTGTGTPILGMLYKSALQQVGFWYIDKTDHSVKTTSVADTIFEAMQDTYFHDEVIEL